MKKILIIHTNYQEFGGEDQSVKNEINLLKNHYEVETLIETNNITSFFNDFFAILFRINFKFEKTLESKINEFQPDFIYIHNIWYKISLSAFRVLKNYEIPTYLKIHNFRYYCTQSFFIKNHLKNKHICEACGLRKNAYILFNKYFSESYFKSFISILFGKKYFQILKSSKINLIVLTEFHKKFLLDLGVNKNKVNIIPNFIETHKKTHSSKEKNYFLYAGRISEEKGLYELIKSFNRLNPKGISLKIIGNGPSLHSLKNKFVNKQNVEFLGTLKNNQVLEIMSKAKAVITVTKLYEGQPTLLCEASSLGIPSIFPNTGGIKEFFPESYKLKFEQFNYEDLHNKLELCLDDEVSTTEGINNKNFISKILNEDFILEKFKETFV